ncbi:aspartate/glutamate racemase family protein [Pseudoxanthobacter sp.]|uniref:aspartate/glutamate racemase family protein n=1 Tax=Pseudoxanthobacter sp. TaxID=1925742 RepID=UPI002FE3A030
MTTENVRNTESAGRLQTVLRARPGAQSYGHDIGILMIECLNPFIPGDVGNAWSYRYPVLYRTITDVSIERLIEHSDLSLLPKVIEAAQDLERHGVAAITSDCGYMLLFQDDLARAINIPVMLSSLLQLPFIGSILGPERSIGIVCANAPRLTPALLARAWPNPTRRLHIAGLERASAFRHAILDEKGSIDVAAVEAEVVAAACALTEAHPDIGAILLECSNIPPYAHAVQAATGRPVFDFLTMIDLVRSAGRREPPKGWY